MDTSESLAAVPPHRGARLLRAGRPAGRKGQSIVEFALVSMAFFMITLGTIDVGRAMYEYHQLTNAVREGARVGEAEPPNETRIKDSVIAESPALGLTYDDITRSCTGGCDVGSSDVTVAASKEFTPLLGEMFGWAEDFSITLSSSATVEAD